MVGADENFPKFKTVDEKPEVLDPKSGKYSSGLKIQEISAGDEKGLAVEDGRTVSLQVPLIFPHEEMQSRMTLCAYSSSTF